MFIVKTRVYCLDACLDDTDRWCVRLWNSNQVSEEIAPGVVDDCYGSDVMFEVIISWEHADMNDHILVGPAGVIAPFTCISARRSNHLE